MSGTVKRNFVARAIIRADELPLSHNAMVVLAVMATWADRREAHPVYFADQGRVARRGKLSPRALRNALTELERAGAVKRLGVSGGGFNRETGMVTRGTVRWGLTLLEDIDEPPSSEAAPRADKSIHEPPSSEAAPRADKRPAPRADKRPAPRADKPGRNQSDPKGASDDDDSGSGTRPSAGAPAGPAPSDAPAEPSPTETLLSRIVKITEWPTQQATAWLAEFTERNKGRSGIGSWPAYVLGSARRAVAAIETAAPDKPAGKANPTGKGGKPAKAKRTVSPEGRARGVERRRAADEAAAKLESEAAERERAAGPAVGECVTCGKRRELALLAWPVSGFRGHGLCAECLGSHSRRDMLTAESGRYPRCAKCFRRFRPDGPSERPQRMCPLPGCGGRSAADEPASGSEKNRPTDDPPPPALGAQRPAQRAGGVSYSWQQAVRGGKCPSCDSPALVPVDGCGFYCEAHSR